MSAEFEVKGDSCVAGTFPDICAFRYINGGALALISLCGMILNVLVMFVIVRKVRLSNQKYFMFNLAISDILVAFIGLCRGLGIIDPAFVGYVDGKETVWCSVYLLFMMFVSYSNCPCMLAITIDRLVAIVAPFKHRTLFTKRFCIGLCVLVWLPQVVFYCWFIAVMSTDSTNFSVNYYANYHRCQNSYKIAWIRSVRFIVLVWAPFAAIILMYCVIIYRVIRSGTKSRRLLYICTVIILSGIACWFPSIISSIFSIPMNYKIGQFFTVTLFYVNSSTDPLVYVLLMPAVKKYVVARFFKCEEPPAPPSSISSRCTSASTVSRCTSGRASTSIMRASVVAVDTGSSKV